MRSQGFTLQVNDEASAQREVAVPPGQLTTLQALKKIILGYVCNSGS